MKIEYVVATAALSKVPMQTQINGVDVVAEVPMAVIEAISADGTMVHTFKIMADAEAVVAQFPAGSRLTVTIEPSED